MLLSKVFLTLAGLFSCSALQCSAPVPDNGVSYMPDVPASVTDLGTTVNTNSNFLYIYPGGSLNCNGTVTGVEYCYRGGSSSSTYIFTIFVMTSMRAGINDIFTVTREIPIPTPTGQCSDRMICCDSYNFTNEHFELPQDDFNLGVLTPSGAQQVLGFHSAQTQYFVPGYFMAALTTDAPTVVVSTLSGANQSLRIIRLIVDSSPVTATTPSPTAQPVTDPPDTTQASTTPEPTTSNPTIDSDTTAQTTDTNNPTDPATGTDSPTTDSTDGSTTTTDPTSSNTGATSDPQTANNTAPTVVGVVIGLLVALVLVIVGVLVVVMCIRKSRTRNWGSKHVVGSDGNLKIGRQAGFDNALYNTSDAVLEVSVKESALKLPPLPNALYDYATPDQPTATNQLQATSPDSHEYATADDLTALKSDEDPYSYASTLSVSSSDTSGVLSLKGRPNKTFTGGSKVTRGSITDAIYMAPAADENSLYVQFTEIKIKALSHALISLKEKLGSGQFGTVHKAEWRTGEKSSQMVAVKTLNKADPMDKIKFLQEAAIMGQFKHPNVVKLYGVVLENEPIMIVLELLLAGDLRNHLIESKGGNKPSLDASTLLSYCRQIASGMTYLSSKAFVHRDLAARNILMSEDGVCKIADFGMSRDLMDETYYISHGGKIPVRWTAPEALHYKKYSTASDVWSFGCVMYEIWSLGHKPFEAFSNNQTISEVDEGYRMAPPPGTPRNIYKHMIECWHPLKAERPTFIELMQGFSLPETMLLKWTEEDKTVHPDVSVLGAQLNCTENLYLDLQESYITSNQTVGPYEVPVPIS